MIFKIFIFFSEKTPIYAASQQATAGYKMRRRAENTRNTHRQMDGRSF